MRLLAAILLAPLFAISLSAKDASVVKGKGVFLSSPAGHEAKSVSGLFFGSKSLELRIHFRADTVSNQWCCVYVNRRIANKSELLCMLIFETDGKSLFERSIGYQFELEKGDSGSLSLWTVDGGKRTATIKADLGVDSPGEFRCRIGNLPAVRHLVADGRAFYISSGGETYIEQLDEYPRSYSHDDLIILAKRIAGMRRL